MKRWFSLWMVLVLCVALSGCGGTATEDTNSTTTTTTTATTTTVTMPNGFMSEAQALSVAEGYWNIKSGDRDPDTGYVMSLVVIGTPTTDDPHYTVALQWMVEVDGQPSHQSRLDTVTIHAVNGGILMDLG